MSAKPITEIIEEIILDQLGVNHEQVTIKAELCDDLGADSFDMVELIATIEDHFDIDIKKEDAKNILTVGDMINYVTHQIGSVNKT